VKAEWNLAAPWRPNIVIDHHPDQDEERQNMKSRTNDAAAERGNSNRGKKTLETRFASSTKLFEVPIRDCEKKLDGTRAQYANKGYGTPRTSPPAEHPTAEE